MNKICYIFGAGEYYDNKYSFNDGDYIIAADGGYMQLKQHNITPNIVIGDFDSMQRPDHPNILEFSSEKNETDMMIAIKHGLSKGYRVFRLYGGTGGRIDHTMANIQSLSFIAQNNAIGFLYGDKYTMTAISNRDVSFGPQCKGYISVFSLTDYSFGVNLSGLKYELTDHTLSSNDPLGVSNEFIGAGSTISVRNGTLLICIENQH